MTGNTGPATLTALAAEQSTFGARTREALATIDQAISFYGERHLAISFNGGKDCTVLLQLYAAVLCKRRKQGSANPPTRQTEALDHGLVTQTPLTPDVFSGFDERIGHDSSAIVGEPIRSVYIYQPDTFHEVEAFLDDCVQRYQLRLTRIKHESMRDGLEQFLQLEPDVRAILVGTRRTDPYSGHLKLFTLTDNGWPLFMRVNPIIDWDYDHVWRFIRRLRVPYCHLYDQGFTSLGSRTLTVPNPSLQRGDGSFSPAYELSDGSMERSGRLHKTKDRLHTPS